MNFISSYVVADGTPFGESFGSDGCGERTDAVSRIAGDEREGTYQVLLEVPSGAAGPYDLIINAVDTNGDWSWFTLRDQLLVTNLSETPPSIPPTTVPPPPTTSPPPPTTSPPPPTTSPPPTTTVALSPTETVAEFGDAAWKVEANGCGFSSSGSSFAIGSRYLVTNQHVISNDSTPTVVSRNGRVLQGTVVGATTDPDIAVIEVTEDLGTSLEWADTDSLAEGDAILAIGYPTPHTEFTVTPGMIMSFLKEGNQRIAIRTDADVDSGNSGGPALTALGEVAGVVTLIEEGTWRNAALLYTSDHLEATINSLISNKPGYSADCESGTSDVGVPQNVSTETPVSSTQGNYKVTVTWSSPAGSSASQIDHYIVGGLIWDPNAEEFLETGKVEAVTTGTQTNIELDGLLAGNEYDIFVFASDQVGELSEPGVCLSCVNTPAATSNLPTGGTISSGQSINAYLPPYQSGQWTFYGVAGGQVQIDMVSTEIDTMLALADPTGSEIANDDDSGSGYNARISTGLCTTGTYTITADSYGSTSVGVEYTISLSGGTTNAGACQVPTAPRNLTAQVTAYTDNIRLNWSEPSVGGNACASYYCPTYRIEQSTNGSNWTLVSAATTSTSKSIYSVAYGTTYHFRISATNDNGTGPWAQTTITPSTTPDRPELVAVCRVGDSSEYRVSWSQPSSEGGSPITSYRVKWGSSQNTNASSPVTITITTSYGTTVFVYASNANGESNSASVYVSSYSTDTCPGTETSAPTLAVPSVQSTTGNSVTLVLPAKPSGFDDYGSILGYGVFTSSGSPSSWCNGCVVSNSWDYNGGQWGTTTTSASSLTAGTTYYVRWMIRDTEGEETWSSPTTFTTTAPAAGPVLVSSVPADGATGVVVNTQIILTFDQPVYAGPGGLHVRRASDGQIEVSQTVETAATGLGSNQITLTPFCGSGCAANLLPLTDYYITIAGPELGGCEGQAALLNASGDSEADPAPYAGICDSTTLNFTTGDTQTIPTLAAPTVNSVTGNSVTLTLPSEPSSYVSGSLLGYGVFTSSGSPSSWCSGCVVSNSWDYNGGQWGTTTTSASSLTAGTTYYVRWMIRDASSEEAWSTATPFTTTAQPPTPTLAAPSVQSTTGNSVTLTLPSKPAGFDDYGSILGYGVFTSSGSPSSWCSGCVVSNSWDYNGGQWGTTTTSASSLTAGTTYYVRWMIRDTAGEETWSSATSFMPQPALPTLSIPTVQSVTETSATFTLPPKPVGYDDYGESFGWEIVSSCVGGLNTVSQSWTYSNVPWGTTVTAQGLSPDSGSYGPPANCYALRFYLYSNWYQSPVYPLDNAYFSTTSSIPTLAAPSFNIGSGEYVVFSVPAKPSGFSNPEDSAILGLGIFETSGPLPETCPPGSNNGCSMDPCFGDDGYEVCINGGSWVYDGAPWGSTVDVAKSKFTAGTTYFTRWMIRDGGDGVDQWSSATPMTLS